MALTLLEAAKLAFNNGETKRAGVIATFARASAWLADIPFKNIPGNSYAYDREQTLPGIAFRGINESYTASTVVVNPQSEALRIGGGYLDVYRALLKMMGDQVRSTHEAMKAKALAAEISRVVIKGDSTTNAREFDGLQARLTGNQLVENGSTDGGDVLSMFQLDTAISRCAGPNKRLWLPKLTKLRITQAARTTTVGGYVTYTTDQFGRQVEAYNGIPLVEEYPENDGTETLAFDELGSTGSTATASSIYCVSLSDGFVSGIQNGVMEVIDQGLLDSEVKVRTLVEWLIGMVVEHPRAAVRLRGIKTGAAVA